VSSLRTSHRISGEIAEDMQDLASPSPPSPKPD
jgi:hypothetical protein